MSVFFQDRNFVLTVFDSQRLELMRMVYNEEVSEANSPEDGLLRCIPNTLVMSGFSLGNLLPSRLVPLHHYVACCLAWNGTDLLRFLTFKGGFSGGCILKLARNELISIKLFSMVSF